MHIIDQDTIRAIGTDRLDRAETGRLVAAARRSRAGLAARFGARVGLDAGRGRDHRHPGPGQGRRMGLAAH